ncbi:brain tumor protein [Neocloeon triangulifer]|uniref:brain tumor protein n=1 Tax=Neocloeon triangulifer TaxID=2078957 RepID=UPI00286F8345|nr:brain tumor protein [Neocloeon triangulifer]XP_059480607.1 brain tumor protein [Neocloeon triangulifer]XP_059480609.1 brain tumor protein [Neocloeon triangulifer]
MASPTSTPESASLFDSQSIEHSVSHLKPVEQLKKTSAFSSTEEGSSTSSSRTVSECSASGHSSPRCPEAGCEKSDCCCDPHLLPRGITELLSDLGLLESEPPPPPQSFANRSCTGCKSRDSPAVGRCLDCANLLCGNCVMAHQFMHCFEGHRVVSLEGKDEPRKDKVVSCPRHKSEQLKLYCRACSMPVCAECTAMEHPGHETEHISDAAAKHVEYVTQLVQEAKGKAADLRNVLKTVDYDSQRLQMQHHKAQNEINETFQFYTSMLEERKQELLKELESVYSNKSVTLSVTSQKCQDKVDKLYQTCEFLERMLKQGQTTELLMFKKLLDQKMHTLMAFNPEPLQQSVCDLEFVSNYQAIQVGVRNTFGYVRNADMALAPGKMAPIARPTAANLSVIGAHLNGGSSLASTSSTSSLNSLNSASLLQSTVIDKSYTSSLFGDSLSKPFATSVGNFGSANILSSSSFGDLNLNNSSGTTTGLDPYQKWSNGGSDSIFHHSDAPSPAFLTPDPLELTSKLMSTTIFPPKSQIKRQKMIYHCKFGEFGVMEGQFTEPSGVAVNAQNDIIVADTNNHRIQIFDKEGRFKFQFGECGKRDGQLLYPNRVAVVKPSGDIIVTERSPTHQIQIYNQYGQFVRKFGANILQHPRGVTVDNKGRIVVVECKVMRVIIFDQGGNVLQKFGCSKHLEFPNGVVVNDKQEIFISDNRAHCVKVFNYEGTYLRQIGGEGITNYPIGVGINLSGEILIADNHNNFNLTIFTQDGQLVSALESKVKHAQCFDVALMDDGSVVLASKDYRLYIYRYVQVPPSGM